MNVFVLGTGRCGTKTFAKACAHLTNFTSGHESRCWAIEGRVKYPENHVESDSRLSWFLGLLDRDYPDAHYVWLTRDKEAVAQSWLRRWDSSPFLRFFRVGMVSRKEQVYARRECRLQLCELVYETIETALTLFLRQRAHVMEMQLERAKEQFPGFLTWIGAEGDLDAATAEWDVRHNASRGQG